MKQINVSVLAAVANDYFYQEEQLRLFLRTWKPGYLEFKPAKEQVNYVRYSEKSHHTYSALIDMCRLIGVDYNSVVATVKAINRWEKHGGRWDRSTSIGYERAGYDTESRFIRFVCRDDDFFAGHYKSTGRMIKA